MNIVIENEEKKLIREIISVIIFLVIIIPICVSASNDYNEKEEYLESINNVYISLYSSNSSSSNAVTNKVITISNGNEDSIRVCLIFKIAKFYNNYTLKLGDNSYNLSELDYSEDEEYLYYNLGYFEVDDEVKYEFSLVLNDDVRYDKSIKYSFLLEGI